MKKQLRFISMLLALGMLVMASAAVAQEPDPETCVITRSSNECGPVELCGPEGEDFYRWHGPGLPAEGVVTRCITVTQDGTWDLETFNETTQLKSECQATVDFEECKEPPPCRITSSEDGTICDGEKTELCGPEGDYEYLWSGPGVDGETTRCVSASASGTYGLQVTDPGTKLSSRCEFELKVEECQNNCPRTPGYWLQQAEQKDNGSTKFSRADVIAIAMCVDARVDYFNWGSGESALEAFRATVTAGGPGWNQKKQAARHLASTVANLCAGGYTPTHGGDVFLDGSTTVTCGGVSYTIDELVDAVDDALQADEGYHDLAGCLDAINNGRGIGPLCDGKKDEAKLDGLGRGGLGIRDLSGSLQLYRPYPNPFTGTMRMSYAVEGSGQKVDIGVYDIAGRLVQNLASGFQPGGIQQVEWNGRDARGGRVGVGVYFVRGLVGDRQVNSRIVLTQ